MRTFFVVSCWVVIFCLPLVGHFWIEANKSAERELRELYVLQEKTARQARKFMDKLERTPRHQWTELQRQGYQAAQNALKED